jgi:hypothetical protein
MSIGSLLLYFFGAASFFKLSMTMSGIELVLIACLIWWAWRMSWKEAKGLLAAGFWAGCLATLAYDVVRVPIVHGGIPVFKAISYFGTVLLGQSRPSAISELFGWGYHLSNGVSFALMYMAAAVRPGPFSAILWGLSLEGAMLVTPYAEVFGYQRDARFMAITVGSHAIYGFVLWWGLRRYRMPPVRFSAGWRIATLGLVPLLLAVMAIDFNLLYASKIPQSPPPYMGRHLYTVWNVPEPDRVAVMWLLKRFVDHDAEFRFIEPFEKVNYGRPFDMPEADIRRSGTQSATQVLMTRSKLSDAKLEFLARTTGLTEVTPWMLASDSSAEAFAGRMRSTADRACGKKMSSACFPMLLQNLDDWYSAR